MSRHSIREVAVYQFLLRRPQPDSVTNLWHLVAGRLLLTPKKVTRGGVRWAMCYGQ